MEHVSCLLPIKLTRSWRWREGRKMNTYIHNCLQTKFGLKIIHENSALRHYFFRFWKNCSLVWISDWTYAEILLELRQQGRKHQTKQTITPIQSSFVVFSSEGSIMNDAMLQALKIEYLNSLTWILCMLFSLDHLLNKSQ